METRKTHFEQIPITTVKKIADEFSANKIGHHAPEAVSSHPESWREVAKRVQKETDSGKMIELVRKLITTYDEETTQNRGGRLLNRTAPTSLKPAPHDTPQ